MSPLFPRLFSTRHNRAAAGYLWVQPCLRTCIKQTWGAPNYCEEGTRLEMLPEVWMPCYSLVGSVSRLASISSDQLGSGYWENEAKSIRTDENRMARWDNGILIWRDDSKVVGLKDGQTDVYNDGRMFEWKLVESLTGPPQCWCHLRFIGK